ncbi:MFS transporter [Glutamicibacter sp. JL.03c]|uniref:MFS transporter n=1 Tax=Glutamicibacter sp. JL.03c TaxID=2984842 RepID=UPI0021F7C2F9|nr:MFS transporter [Glutamicibacter sp. JL.03c]UYQ77849.1 MFS transporter [Glutamicibacter sp. JL.03c]
MALSRTDTRSRSKLLALTATHAGNDFYTGAVAALLPFFVLHAHYTYAAVAGIALASTALSSVAQPLFGYLSDRYRLRWLSLAGLILAGVGVALSGIFVESYWAAWVVIAASGVGVAAYHPAATMEAREAGGGSNSSMSFFSVGGNLGVALAPAAVVLVVGWFGLSGTLWLIIPAIILGLVYMAATWTDISSPVAIMIPSPSIQAPIVSDSWRLFAWLTAVLATWSIAYVGTSTFISLYATEKFQSSTAEAAVALSVFPAAGALGTLIGGFFADRFGRLRVIRAGYLLAACSTAAMVLAPTELTLTIATAALGVNLFIPFAAQITLSHSYLPNRIGVASGVTLGLTLSLGGVISPLLGVVADRYTVWSVFVIMTVVLIAGFALSWILTERRTEPSPVEPTLIEGNC